MKDAVFKIIISVFYLSVSPESYLSCLRGRKRVIFSFELHCDGMILSKQPPLYLCLSACDGDDAVK